MDRHILAMGGVAMADTSPLLRFALELTGKERPRVLLLPTAVGDSSSFIVLFYEAFPPERCEARHLRLFGVPPSNLSQLISEQDLVVVSGGNTANMLAVWRVHGVDVALREAWESGTVLCGSSAGCICWFQAGVTDSFSAQLDPLHDGLGLLEGSACPHYDGEPLRRPTYERLISEGFPPGYAVDNFAGLHFVGTELREVVCEAPSAGAYRVERDPDGGVRETPLETRLLA